MVERVLLVVNAKARSYAPRKKEVIEKALSADFKLEVATTQARAHASALAQQAVDDSFDAVIAFGGDGTLNEVTQPIVGTEVMLGVIPGGQTNVIARTTGIPLDPVEATAVVAARLRARAVRRVNVGLAGTRYFLFAAGMGLDAEVVRRVHADPQAKQRWGEWLFVSKALRTVATRYRGADPAITLQVGDETHRVVFAVAAKARPFTYFRGRPVDACPDASLDRGLSVLGITKVRAFTIPRMTWSILVRPSHVGWRIARYFPDVDEASFVSDRPQPVQVDGEYLGDRSEFLLRVRRDALSLLV